jgi:hypothetical protein
MQPLRILALVLAAMPAVTLAVSQDKAVQKETVAAAPEAPVVPLKVDLTIARYQGEKHLSSVPYTLSVTTGARNVAHLRMTAQIPVVSTSLTPTTPGGAGVNPLISYQYKDVGTNIDCSATVGEAGRYLLAITIDDSSVYPEGEPTKSPTGAPSFRSFRSSETVVLRDGQSTQFVAATDKITGERVKIDVALTVMK